MDRRRFLASSGVLAGAWLLRTGGVASAVDPDVRPREEWGADLAPTGPLEQEAPGDVLFLLVHHSASANSYSAEAVPGILASFYRHHTGAKGWPDIAYNFLVDRYGRVWEGRAGSLAGPVKGDATGGSQGFAQLACFIGDHSTQPPTPQAADAMAGLCAALAHRYGIPTAPGSLARFVSRGSNRHAAGVPVETPTIAGHRDMSLTACPGDAGYAFVTGDLPGRVAALQAALGAGQRAVPPSGEAGGGDPAVPSPRADPEAAGPGSAPRPAPAPPPGPTPRAGPDPSATPLAVPSTAPAASSGGDSSVVGAAAGLLGLTTAAAVVAAITQRRRSAAERAGTPPGPDQPPPRTR